MTIRPEQIHFACTCDSFPEQYVAYLDGRAVAYLRLRSGWFYAACPGLTGEVVLEADVRDVVGRFATEADRRKHLDAARVAIADWCNARQGAQP